eukprot:TRINITY_DN936_c0_g2_i2.p1 TRINITY_DN936_c0_g2~~TRINITY_DN936_c0_g2_i2.p1  ORF type:complete len:427 (+),score=123.32 TRINITY_DN936_c0_g2_i2:1300-2580(+)
MEFRAKPMEAEELNENRKLYAQRVSKCKKYKNLSGTIGIEEKDYYDKLLDDPVSGCLMDNMYDFLNMAFGKDQDTDTFWEKILLPRAAVAFKYPLEKLDKAKVNLNALFFAFIQRFGLEIDYKKPFELGKTEKPLTDQIKDMDGVCRVYRFRNIPYRVLAGRYKEYKNSGKKELALKALRMKLTIEKLLYNRMETTALAELAEILLEGGIVDKSIQKTTEGIRYIHPLNSGAVKFYCVLMRALYEKKSYVKADGYCYKAIKCLDFHWGQHHPLHATIYSILAYLIMKHRNDLQQAQALYKASLICCNRALGPKHLHTAEVYMDFGRLYLKMSDKDRALANFVKAFEIYEEVSLDRCYGPVANSGLQIAVIKEAKHEFKEALPYARRATDVYLGLYGAQSELYISSLWVTVRILYGIAVNDIVSLLL